MAAPYQTGAKLKGKCLVATPQLTHTMWEECVIYITDHDSSGAKGYVINRPSQSSINKLLDEFNYTAHGSNFPDIIHMGGPLKERNITMLHSGNWYSSSTVPVTNDISISGDDFMLEKMALHDSPEEFLMLAGHAGWAPKQLETEVTRGSWLVVDANPAIVFSSKKSQLWSLCLEIYSHSLFEDYFG